MEKKNCGFKRRTSVNPPVSMPNDQYVRPKLDTLEEELAYAIVLWRYARCKYRKDQNLTSLVTEEEMEVIDKAFAMAARAGVKPQYLAFILDHPLLYVDVTIRDEDKRTQPGPVSYSCGSAITRKKLRRKNAEAGVDQTP